MKKKLSRAWIDRIFLRLQAIYGDKFIKNFDTVEILELSKEEWASALGDMTADEIREALDKCRDTLDWPPVPSQFRCLGRNIISEQDALQAAIRRDLSDPIVLRAFNKVGSWDMSHAEDKALRKKWAQAYKESVDYIDSCNLGSNAILSSDNLKALPSHSDDPEKSTDELCGPFKDINFEGKYSLWWCHFKYSPGKRGFVKSVYFERRAYLMSLNEMQALSRSREDQYDRIRFLSEEEANKIVESNKLHYQSQNPVEDNEKAKNDHRRKARIINYQDRRYND